MHRVDSANSVAVRPTPAAPGTPGFFSDGPPGTVADADSWNAFQEEFADVIETIGGLSLDKADVNQLRKVLEVRIKAIRNASSDTGSLSTAHTAAVIASFTSRASGSPSAVVAGDSLSHASGDRSLVAASAGGEADGDNCAVVASAVVDNDGDQSAIVASIRSTIGPLASASAVVASAGVATTDIDVKGDKCAVVASSGTAALPIDIDSSSSEVLVAAAQEIDVNGATNSAAIAAKAVTLSGADSAAIAVDSDGTSAPNVSGTTGAAIASRGDVLVGGNRCAALSCLGEVQVNGTQAAAIATGEAGVGTDVDLSGTNAAAIGVRGDVAISGTGTVVVASLFDGAGLTISDANSLVGGEGAQKTWRIQSSNGEAFFEGGSGAGPADYAEFFENLEANELGRGLLVARDGAKVRLASAGDRILGVVSVRPAVLGNAAPFHWSGKYKVDQWGEPVTEPVKFLSWPALEERWVKWSAIGQKRVQWDGYDGPVKGAGKIPKDAERYTVILREAWDGLELDAVDAPEDAKRYAVIVRPAGGGRASDIKKPPSDATKETRQCRVLVGGFDPKAEYVTRAERGDEWTKVGLLGQLRVRVDATVLAGDDVMASVGGIGTSGSSDVRGACIECMEITSPHSEARGYAIALCMVR